MKTHIKKLCDEWYNKGRADADAENKISYDVGYEKGRADMKREIEEHSVFYSNRPIEDIVLEVRADAIDELSDLIDRLLWDYDMETYKDLSESFKESARLLKEQNNG